MIDSRSSPSGLSTCSGAAGSAPITPAVAEFAQEHARLARLRLRRPERAGEQQGVTGAGHGDVGEASFLVLGALAAPRP